MNPGWGERPEIMAGGVVREHRVWLGSGSGERSRPADCLGDVMSIHQFNALLRSKSASSSASASLYRKLCFATYSSDDLIGWSDLPWNPLE